MNRREFSALLPLLFASHELLPAAQGQTGAAQPASPAATLKKLSSGQYEPGPAANPQAPRASHHYLAGMLPDNIRLEAHMTMLAPGAPPEKVDHHKHTEIWFVREGTVSLMTSGTTRILKAGDMGLCIAGDDHSITNASATEPASYFVVTVGPPE